MDAPLIHYSKAPLVAVHSVEQKGSGPKPSGLWFSAGEGEDGWKAWCQSESFNLSRFACETEVVLRPDARVLRLSNAGEIDDFTREYGRTMPFGRVPASGIWEIDWPRIAGQHDGIIIAPYCLGRRYEQHTSWYYGWDVASGCVWNAAAVAELRPRLVRAAA